MDCCTVTLLNLWTGAYLTLICWQRWACIKVALRASHQQSVAESRKKRGPVGNFPWLVLVLWILFSALTLLVWWQEGRIACNKNFVVRNRRIRRIILATGCPKCRWTMAIKVVCVYPCYRAVSADMITGCHIDSISWFAISGTVNFCYCIVRCEFSVSL